MSMLIIGEPIAPAEDTPAPTEGQVSSMLKQLMELEPGEPFVAVLTDDVAYVRSTRGVSPTLVELWKRHPSMLVPDSPGHRHPSTPMDLADL